MLAFPQIDPIAFEIFGLPFRWYGLAYAAAFLLALEYSKLICKRTAHGIKPEQIDNIFIYIVLGVILGGRLGYVLFYNLPFYMENPGMILQTWKGGMSYHGGLVGVLLAMLIFAKRNKVQFRAIGDVIAASIPIGLFFGRLANFINGELYGRVTSPDFPLAMVFPHAGEEPRHPSQLYEAALEGIVLFIILLILSLKTSRRGLVGGAFLLGYGIFRSLVEFVRTPDDLAHLKGGIYMYLTQGQILSLPMIAAGIYFIITAKKMTNDSDSK